MPHRPAADEQDFRALHSLAHSDGVERLQLKRLVDTLFAGLPERHQVTSPSISVAWH